MIPDLDKWCDRAHGLLNYHLPFTQALTEHGCFRKFLQRIIKEPTGGCLYCGLDVKYGKHTLFECVSWVTERIKLQWALNSVVDESNIVALMLNSSEARDAISEFISGIMSEKENEDRQREVLVLMRRHDYYRSSAELVS